MDTLKRLLPGTPPVPRSSKTASQIDAPPAIEDAELRLDTLPVEILGMIFKFIILDAWIARGQAVFDLQKLIRILFPTNPSSKDNRLSPVAPARACKLLFSVAVSQIKLITFVDVPLDGLALNVRTRRMSSDATIFRSLVNVSLVILLGGHPYQMFNSEINTERTNRAVRLLNRLQGTTPNLKHLFMHVELHPLSFSLPPRPIQRLRRHNHVDVEESLTRIIETVRALHIKTVDLSWDKRSFRQIPWEGADDEASTLAYSMLHQSGRKDYVWRVQGGSGREKEEEEIA